MGRFGSIASTGNLFTQKLQNSHVEHYLSANGLNDILHRRVLDVNPAIKFPAANDQIRQCFSTNSDNKD